MSTDLRQTDIKRPGPKWHLNIHRNGGNKLMQTFRLCAKCNREFGPLTRKARRYCTPKCAYSDRKPRVSHKHVPNKNAERAYKKIAWAVHSGRLVRPNQCEQCGANKKRIEAAHYDYSKPLEVRWLCRSCHVRWDSNEPKGGTKLVERWQKFSGKKAHREDGVLFDELKVI